MIKQVNVLGQSYCFNSLKEILAKANEEKSGDRLACISASDSKERMAAKYVLAQLTLEDIRNNPVLPPEKDEVSMIIEQGVDKLVYRKIRNWSISELREFLLDNNTKNEDIEKIRSGLTSEMIAAVTKLMTNLDLIMASAKMQTIVRCNYEVGHKGILASRAQPNHPSDNVAGIKAGLYEALSYGIGDAVIGINPVNDSVESVGKILSATKEEIDKWSIPTQNCVLAHVTTQMKAIEKGAPADLIFQSLAGTAEGNRAFGINKKLLDEADALIQTKGTAKGPNRWYFETGQGSELSSGTHAGIDQLTLEARCYGLAKKFHPFLVNTVVGFIGPEYLYDSKQVIRAGLEDHFMGKLHGLPMGVDVCYTNHMKADQNDMDNLGVLLASAGAAFLISVPLSDDCMLNYQSLSFHDIATLRELLGFRPTVMFEKWLESKGIMENGKLTSLAGNPLLFC